MEREDLKKIAEGIGMKAGSLKEVGFPWHKRFLIKVAPRLFMKLESRKLGLSSAKIDLADKLFGNPKRIDIEPLFGGSRGFIIYLDGKLSFWFFQDSDHFVYDGFEMGEYGKGDVTIFDNLKR